MVEVAEDRGDRAHRGAGGNRLKKHRRALAAPVALRAEFGEVEPPRYAVRCWGAQYMRGITWASTQNQDVEQDCSVADGEPRSMIVQRVIEKVADQLAHIED